MSEHHAEEPAVSGRAVVAGILLAAALGALAGVLYSAAAWTRPVSIEGSFNIFAYMVLAGFVVGGGTGLVLGLILAWHGAKTSADPASPDAAPIWGAIAAVLLGLFFGPVAGSALSLAFGQLAGGILLGLAVGPILGLLAWETGYWLSQIGARN